MKIVCTQSQKDYLINLFSHTTECMLDNVECGEIDCDTCIRECIEWQIEDGEQE